MKTRRDWGMSADGKLVLGQQVGKAGELRDHHWETAGEKDSHMAHGRVRTNTNHLHTLARAGRPVRRGMMYGRYLHPSGRTSGSPTDRM